MIRGFGAEQAGWRLIEVPWRLESEEDSLRGRTSTKLSDASKTYNLGVMADRKT
jgi:hypothetical protein